MKTHEETEKEVIKFIEDKYKTKINDIYDGLGDYDIDCGFSLCFELGEKFGFDGYLDGGELTDHSSIADAISLVQEMRR